jgi:asparagine synthase (glutamine-hydrolysing)
LAYEDASKRFDKFDDETALFFTDLTVQLPSQFLTKVDRASMTASVEARVPLLDDELVSFALKLSPSDRTSLKKSKKLLYDSQSLRLPGKVLKSKKQGFGTPYGEWLRKGLRVFASDHILNTSFMSRFNLDSSKVEKLIADHNNHISDNGFLIWKILQMAIWVEVQTK